MSQFFLKVEEMEAYLDLIERSFEDSDEYENYLSSFETHDSLLSMAA